MGKLLKVFARKIHSKGTKMTSKLSIENTSWTVGELIAKIGDITKPKFQRKKKWLVVPNAKKNRANSKDYILFLFRTKNTVDPISFGEEIKNGNKMYINVDGNNRINSIMHFIQKPFEIFPEYLADLISYIGNLPDMSISSAMTLHDFFRSLDYKTISLYKRLKNLYNDNVPVREIFDKMSAENYGKIDEFVEQIQQKILLPTGDSFEKGVKLNINLFLHASFDELCKIFEDINKHNNGLSQSELLASTLFNVDVTILDQDMNFEIRKEIKTYYDEKNVDEVLKGFHIDNINSFKINAFDYIVGFQNYCSKKYENIIPPFDAAGVSMFFKLYKLLCGGLETEQFDSEHIAEFTQYMVDSCKLMSLCVNQLFPENIDETLFSRRACKDKFELKKNNLFVVVAAIIGMLKNGFVESDILKRTQIAIVYHLLVKEIDNTEKRDLLKIYDKIMFEAGGSYVENLAAKILKHPEQLSSDISEARMKEVCLVIIGEINEPITYEAKKRTNKRRKLSFLENLLSSFYYKNFVSINYLNNKYWNEHIVPFSCVWADGDLLDIDRVGNLIPIIDVLNRGRGNKHINYYQERDSTFVSFLKNIPSSDVYNRIVNSTERTPRIINIAEYNDLCSKNEQAYVENFVKGLF